MKVIPWGVRGSLPITSQFVQKYGGNTTCFEICTDSDTYIILDAGTGIYEFGKNLPNSGKVHILLSHIHFDHIQGLPFFPPIFNANWEIHFYIPKGTENFLADFFNGEFFPIARKNLTANIIIHELDPYIPLELNGLTIETPHVPHTGLCHGFKFKTNEGSVCIIPDCEINTCSQTKYMENFIQNASLVFIDAHYTHAEYLTHTGWGHNDMTILPALAQNAQVKKLVLFHHAPTREDKELDTILLTLEEQYKHSLLSFAIAKEQHIYTVFGEKE